jgi:putative transposase
VKKDLDPKKTDPNHVQVPWALEALRKRWNQVKDEVAPWWAKNSKECYQAGIADATSALWNCSASKHNKRKGRQVGFLALSRRGGLRTEFA